MRQNKHSNTPLDYTRSRSLRSHATPYEQKLWLALRSEAKKLGLKFRRQQALHPYIVDFACLEARLAIEVDGFSHDLGDDKDKTRSEKIEEMGYMILRFTNEDIADNIEGVVSTILKEAQQLKAI